MFPLFFPDRLVFDQPINLLSIRGAHRYPSSLRRHIFACRFGFCSRADVVSRTRVFALETAWFRRHCCTSTSDRCEI
jgi:hypothetical protein